MKCTKIFEQMDSIEEMLTTLEKAVSEFQADYEDQLGGECSAARADAASVMQLRMTVSEARDEFCQRLDVLRKRVVDYVPDTAEEQLADKNQRSQSLKDLYLSLSSKGLSMSREDVGVADDVLISAAGRHA